MRKIIIFTFFLIVTWGLISSESGQNIRNEAKLIKQWKKKLFKYPFPPKARQLRLIHSFPSEKSEENSVFLWGARFIEADSAGNIYVSDSKAHCVYVFNYQVNVYVLLVIEGRNPGSLSGLHIYFS
ncbi:MAG: hypothetical protein DRJ11_10365 [Candidatus Aminicenantes bacterium]|nr:MAG: hypothetical protein DRJ11_10365 [Candidatus Aminicenantes bacterium]